MLASARPSSSVIPAAMTYDTMIDGPATRTPRPVDRNRPVPIAPPIAIMVCCTDDSSRDSTCSLRTDSGCSGIGGVAEGAGVVVVMRGGAAYHRRRVDRLAGTNRRRNGL